MIRIVNDVDLVVEDAVCVCMTAHRDLAAPTDSPRIIRRHSTPMSQVGGARAAAVIFEGPAATP